MRTILIIVIAIIITSCTTPKTTGSASVNEEVVNTNIVGSWMLETINQSTFDKTIERKKIPILEISPNKKQVFGNDGCNQIRGSLKVLDVENIIFGTFGGTKMMCSEINISERFRQALSLVTTYKIEKLTLYFFDANKKEVLQFKRKQTVGNK